MVEHVKLNIAIELYAEKIDSIYTLLESTNDESLKKQYEQELVLALEDKEKALNGDAEAINKILNERGVK